MAAVFPKFDSIEGNPCMALELLESAYALKHIGGELGLVA